MTDFTDLLSLNATIQVHAYQLLPAAQWGNEPTIQLHTSRDGDESHVDLDVDTARALATHILSLLPPEAE